MSVNEQKTAFVLMPFDASFDDVYNLGIRVACESLGWRCKRVDQQVFHGLIIEKIYEGIVSSDLVIADMSGQNPNVFYEVGFAHALKKKVILLVKNADDMPFDLRGHRHIVYKSGISALQSLLTIELSSISEEAASADFTLGSLTIGVNRPHLRETVDWDSFFNGMHIRKDLLYSNSIIRVPAELSNYARGLMANIFFWLKNETIVTLDLSGIVFILRLPSDVHLAQGSLRAGHGKNSSYKDGNLMITRPLDGKKLEPFHDRLFRFNIISMCLNEGKYATIIPAEIMLTREMEKVSIGFSIEFNPIRRLN